MSDLETKARLLAVIPELGIMAARAWALTRTSSEPLGTLAGHLPSVAALRRRSSTVFSCPEFDVVIMDHPEDFMCGDVWVVQPGRTGEEAYRIGAIDGGWFFDLGALDACSILHDDAFTPPDVPTLVGCTPSTWREPGDERGAA